MGAPWRSATLVGLDVTLRTWLGPEDFAHLAASPSPRARLAHALAERFAPYFRRRYGRSGCPLHDPTAAVLALHPDLATYRHIPVHVELQGALTRGATIADLRDHPEPPSDDRAAIAVAVTIDDAAAVRTVMTGLTRLGPAGRAGRAGRGG
ncbi:hypothetical protein GCM10010191_19070 [Actinomadura vinacea]|uniref:Inosine/uridine-preferring nucleoside hydrolase domain-containing protein n=1 Tax=Actinomadura vinacea TaxID=115336 RepID=A0ABN3IPT8_9ACTN